MEWIVQNILLIDHDRRRRESIAFLLRHMGYVVDVRPGAAVSVEVPCDPDVVLVSEEVLAAHPRDVMPWVLGTFHAPKVVLGTEPEEVAGVPYLEYGADAYLPVPLDARMLLARVRTLMHRAPAHHIEVEVNDIESASPTEATARAFAD